jgi:hypothetical protein
MGAPWMKFYPRDWRGDQALRAVSIAARGLWMECLCIMHEAKPYGHLVLNGGPVDGDALARMTGTPVGEVSALMSELRQAGVLSITSKGVVFSRRMTKDHARAHKGRLSAKKRWSQVSDGVEQSGAPNRVANGSPITQKPEARDQKEEKRPSVQKRSSEPKGSRLSPDWSPGDSGNAYAKAKGAKPFEIQRETEKFKNYWLGKPGKDGVKLDWDRTWQNWCINAAQRGGFTGVPERVSHSETRRDTDDPRSWDELRWRRALNDARANGWPSSMGPMPGEPGAIVPKGLLEFNDRFHRRVMAA